MTAFDNILEAAGRRGRAARPDAGGEHGGGAARGCGKVQGVFNAWAGETGLPLAHLSVTLAASVD